ncbi:thiolase-like protein [Corynascus similis CBS 632.67]
MATQCDFGDLGLSIIGLGTQYPPHDLKPSSLEVLSKRFYPESPAMSKVLSINRYTGIEQRSSIGTPDHPLVNQPNPPTITELNETFMRDGVPLAVSAARKALAEAHVDPAHVTHMVSTTCTNSANPGYDHFVARELDLTPNTEKVLLHGVGCSGGLAALRTAANLCLGHTMRRKPARILVVALEISTTLVRSELESINALQETRIGVALFSDCASACLLSNDIPFSDNSPFNRPPQTPTPAIYSLLGWHHCTIPDTEPDLGFDVDPLGWKVVLSPRVPQLTQSVLLPTFSSLLVSLPASFSSSSSRKQQSPSPPPKPADFDWAMHPGGATILSGAERALGITPEHMRASYDTYMNHGNSSSATILSVLDRLRHKDMDALAPGGASEGVKEHVVGCAFGPGITVEMCMLKRNLDQSGGATEAGRLGAGLPDRLGLARGMETPPETESEGGAGTDLDEASEVGEERSEGGTNVGRVDAKCGSKEDKEAFISEALEELELD